MPKDRGSINLKEVARGHAPRPGARLGALTSKAGMSLSFMGLIIAAARSIGLQIVEGRRRIGLAFWLERPGCGERQYEASVLGDGQGGDEGATQ